MRIRFCLQRLALVLTIVVAAFPADDPVVEKAKQGTRIAVRHTRRGTQRAVRSATTWVVGNPMKPSPDAIARARKDGLVWADHQSWLYYKDGPSYGHTAAGEFWTEDRAAGAGYKGTAAAEKPAVSQVPRAESAKPTPVK